MAAVEMPVTRRAQALAYVLERAGFLKKKLAARVSPTKDNLMKFLSAFQTELSTWTGDSLVQDVVDDMASVNWDPNHCNLVDDTAPSLDDLLQFVDRSVKRLQSLHAIEELQQDLELCDAFIKATYTKLAKAPRGNLYGPPSEEAFVTGAFVSEAQRHRATPEERLKFGKNRETLFFYMLTGGLAQMWVAWELFLSKATNELFEQTVVACQHQATRRQLHFLELWAPQMGTRTYAESIFKKLDMNNGDVLDWMCDKTEAINRERMRAYRSKIRQAQQKSLLNIRSVLLEVFTGKRPDQPDDVVGPAPQAVRNFSFNWFDVGCSFPNRVDITKIEDVALFLDYFYSLRNIIQHGDVYQTLKETASTFLPKVPAHPEVAKSKKAKKKISELGVVSDPEVFTRSLRRKLTEEDQDRMQARIQQLLQNVGCDDKSALATHMATQLRNFLNHRGQVRMSSFTLMTMLGFLRSLAPAMIDGSRDVIAHCLPLFNPPRVPS